MHIREREIEIEIEIERNIFRKRGGNSYILRREKSENEFINGVKNYCKKRTTKESQQRRIATVKRAISVHVLVFYRYMNRGRRIVI